MYVYVTDCPTDFLYSGEECLPERPSLEPVAISEIDLKILSRYLVDNLVIMA